MYENKYIFVAINNAKKVGGIMRLDKAHVEFNDGEFELMLVEFPKDFIQLMKTVGKLFMQDFSYKMQIFDSRIIENHRRYYE